MTTTKTTQLCEFDVLKCYIMHSFDIMLEWSVGLYCFADNQRGVSIALKRVQAPYRQVVCSRLNHWQVTYFTEAMLLSPAFQKRHFCFKWWLSRVGVNIDCFRVVMTNSNKERPFMEWSWEGPFRLLEGCTYRVHDHVYLIAQANRKFLCLGSATPPSSSWFWRKTSALNITMKILGILRVYYTPSLFNNNFVQQDNKLLTVQYSDRSSCPTRSTI